MQHALASLCALVVLSFAVSRQPAPPLPLWPDQFTSEFRIRIGIYGPEWNSTAKIFYDWTSKVCAVFVNSLLSLVELFVHKRPLKVFFRWVGLIQIRASKQSSDDADTPNDLTISLVFGNKLNKFKFVHQTIFNWETCEG